MPSLCYVSEDDYRFFWAGEPSVVVPKEVWSGVERRVSGERRVLRDRRWESARGQRFRLADRRKAGR